MFIVNDYRRYAYVIHIVAQMTDVNYNSGVFLAS